MESRLRPKTDDRTLALGHADAEPAGWGDHAYAFLVRYCRHHHSFIARDVTTASIAWGMIQPLSPNAWGPVFRRAAMDGVIRCIGYESSPLQQRRPTRVWHSMVCKHHA